LSKVTIEVHTSRSYLNINNKEILSDFKTKSFAELVELGDDKCYKIEGVGSISFRLESGARLHFDEVLYVLGPKKNLLSVATLEDKGYWVIFKDRKALWVKGSYLSTKKPIGTRRGVTVCMWSHVISLTQWLFVLCHFY
jgi:hypothetical protein